MYLEELVEVAIGLVLVYVVVSIAVMSLQEWISGLMNQRAKQLEVVLREMLAESLKPAGQSATNRDKPVPAHRSGMLEQIYRHPLIKTLSKADGKPAYIPRDKFVMALFDIVMSAGTDASTLEKALVQLKIYKENLPEALRAGLDTTIDELVKKAEDVQNDPIKLAKLHHDIDDFTNQYTDYDIGAVFEGLLHAQLPVAEAEVIKALKRGAAMLTSENLQLKENLDDLVYMAEMYVKQGESVLAQARFNGEKWFDDAMDRASGWYKRNAQKLAFAIGLILALLFNVDSVGIATQLWIQPTLRQSLAKAAENYQLQESSSQPQGGVTNPAETINRLQNSLSGLHLPIGWTFEALGPNIFDPAVDRCTLFPRPAGEGQKGKDVFGMAINGTCKIWTNPPQGWGILSKTLGFLITGLAAMQGAPFWFDILKNLVNIRNSGVKPEEKEKK